VGCIKEKIEGLVLAYQHYLGCKRLLEELKHTSMVQEYVKRFSSLMLDIKNMSE